MEFSAAEVARGCEVLESIEGRWQAFAPSAGEQWIYSGLAALASLPLKIFSFSCWALRKASLNWPASVASQDPHVHANLAGMIRTVRIRKPNSKRLRLGLALRHISRRIPHPTAVAAHVRRELHVRHNYSQKSANSSPHLTKTVSYRSGSRKPSGSCPAS